LSSLISETPIPAAIAGMKTAPNCGPVAIAPHPATRRSAFKRAVKHLCLP
jgi:hypothetical protein